MLNSFWSSSHSCYKLCCKDNSNPDTLAFSLFSNLMAIPILSVNLGGGGGGEYNKEVVQNIKNTEMA